MSGSPSSNLHTHIHYRWWEGLANSFWTSWLSGFSSAPALEIFPLLSQSPHTAPFSALPKHGITRTWTASLCIAMLPNSISLFFLLSFYWTLYLGAISFPAQLWVNSDFDLSVTKLKRSLLPLLYFCFSLHFCNVPQPNQAKRSIQPPAWDYLPISFLFLRWQPDVLFKVATLLDRRLHWPWQEEFTGISVVNLPNVGWGFALSLNCGTLEAGWDTLMFR